MKSKKMMGMIAAAGILLLLAAGILLFVRWQRCIVTQYADTTGLQSMFYTIETKGKLIVVDGGQTGNAEYVKQVIDEKGGHVDAWILTHPHPDHIGAFNALWNQMADRVDIIYAADFDYDAYQAKAREWDEFEQFTTFLDYMSESDKLTYLHRGSEPEICGLQVKVLSAYEPFVNQISGDLANDGSLMFKVTNKEESMLFCSDVCRVMSESILTDFREDVDCDYLQMGHHGNGGLSEEFYRLTTPKAAFFDAPEWLMNPAEGLSYTTPYNREQMEQMGAQIYYYATAPNKIQLK